MNALKFIFYLIFKLKLNPSMLRKETIKSLYEKMKYVPRINYDEEKDFLGRIGNPANKVIVSIGNGNIPPYFPNTIISDVNIDRMSMTQGRKMEFDAHDMPFNDNSIDIIYGWQVVHHLTLTSLLRELSRVLKPGGKAIFVDNAYSPDWHRLRKFFPRSKGEPKKDMLEDYLETTVNLFGFVNFKARRYNFFAYLSQKAFRHMGIRYSSTWLVKLDKYLSRFNIFKRNLRNMVWSFEKRTNETP